MPSRPLHVRSLHRRRRNHDSGYVMLVLLLMLAVLTLAAIAAAPSVAQQIRRDREEELIKRGQQYARAIKRYYKKFGRYPMNLEQLKETNHLHFLRRQYKDPVSDTGEWRLIHVGEAKVAPLGFFGKKMESSAAGSAGGATPVNAQSAAANSRPASFATSAPGDNNQASAASAPASPSSSFGSPVSIATPPAAGQSFGGGPIVGVASTSTARSIKEFNGKDHYNDWEFVYDPRFDLPQGQVGVAPPGQPGASAPNPQLPGTQNQGPK